MHQCPHQFFLKWKIGKTFNFGFFYVHTKCHHCRVSRKWNSSLMTLWYDVTEEIKFHNLRKSSLPSFPQALDHKYLEVVNPLPITIHHLSLNDPFCGVTLSNTHPKSGLGPVWLDAPHWCWWTALLSASHFFPRCDHEIILIMLAARIPDQLVETYKTNIHTILTYFIPSPSHGHT